MGVGAGDARFRSPGPRPGAGAADTASEAGGPFLNVQGARPIRPRLSQWRVNTCPSHPPHLSPEGLRQADPRLKGSVQSPAHSWSLPPGPPPGPPDVPAFCRNACISCTLGSEEPREGDPGGSQSLSRLAHSSLGHPQPTAPGHRRVTAPREHFTATRDQRRCCSPGKRTALTHGHPSSPHLAGQQQPQENQPPAPSAQGGDWGPGSPPGAHEAAPTCPSSAQNQPYMGKPGAGTHRRPQACPQACSQLQGTWADKLMAASLLRRQEAADFSTAAPDSSARRPPGVRAWRQAAVRLEQVRQRPPSLIPASPGGGCGRDGHHPRACTALPEDSGASAGGGGPTGSWPWAQGLLAAGAVLDCLGPEEQFSQVTGPPVLHGSRRPRREPHFRRSTCPSLERPGGQAGNPRPK